MRILKNIVSEYGIYKKTLTPHLENLDHSKLFGFIIYKNIYCDDFSKLHSDEGTLFDTINQLSTTIKDIENEIKLEQQCIEKELITISNEFTDSIIDLNSTLLLFIMSEIQVNHPIVSIHNKSIYEASKPDIFDSLLNEGKNIEWSEAGNSRQKGHRTFSNYIADSNHNYIERKERILNKSNNRISLLEDRLAALQLEISRIQNYSLKDLANSDKSEQLLSRCKGKPLLKHMIQKGYIDEHYHLYTTIFIEGHMTRSDMDYIMSVKNNTPLNKEKTIHNPEETLKYLSDEEFRNIAFLNYDIIAYLLSKNDTAPLKSLINVAILSHPTRFPVMLDIIDKINNKKEWARILLNEWNTLLTDLIESKEATNAIKNKIISLLLSNLSDYNKFKQIVNSKDHLEEYINDNYSIQSFFPVDDTKRNNLFKSFNYLNIKFKQLSNCKDNLSFLNHVLMNRTFIIDKNNLSTILSSIGKPSNINTLNYSDLKSINNRYFQAILDENIDRIAQLISVDEISINTEFEIIDIINNPEVIGDTKFDLIENVEFTLSEVVNIIDTLFYEEILKNRKLVFSWENIKTIIISEKVSHEILAEIFNNDEITKNLSSSDTTLNQSVSEIVLNIIASDVVDINNFKEVYNFLDYIYQDSELKNLSHDKAAYLITSNELTTTAETFNTLKAISTELSSLFIATNFKSFHKKIASGESIDISTNEFYEILSFDNMSIEDKRIFITSKSDLIDPSKNNANLIIAVSISLEYDTCKDSSIPKIPYDLLTPLINNIDATDTKKHFLFLSFQSISIFNADSNIIYDQATWT